MRKAALGPVLAGLLGMAMLAVGAAHAGLPRAASGPVAGAAPRLAAGPAEPHFDSVGRGQIPRGVVASMAQDSAGFLWIGTGDGLVRFDGYRFRPQELDTPDPSARNLGWVQAMLLGRDGRLWIGTESAGLAVYEPALDRIQLVPGQRQSQPPAAEAAPVVRALAEAADGTLWIGTAGQGLLRLDTHQAPLGLAVSAPPLPNLPDLRVEALLIDRDGDLWVGTWNGLARLRRGAAAFELVPVHAAGPGTPGQPARPNALAERTVQALFQAGDGRIWAGTRQGQVAVIDPASGQGQLVAEPAPPGSGSTRRRERLASSGAVSSFVQLPGPGGAPGGPVWAGRALGIDVFDAAQPLLIQRLRHHLQRSGGLAGEDITSLLRDQAGWVWVGGLGGGLQRHDPGNRSLWLRGADTEPGSPFDQPSARVLLHLRGGDTWVATPRAGVVVMDPELVVVGRLRLPASPGEAAPSVEAMAQAPDGSAWVAVAGQLHQFSPKRRWLRSLAHAAGPVHRLLAGRDGQLWVGSHDGLHLLAPGAPGLQRLALSHGQPAEGDMFSLAEAADGSLWVGSRRGLYLVRPQSREMQPVEADPDAALGNPTVIGLLIDSRQQLWVDTAVAGLHRLQRFDGVRARFDRISQRHGLVGRPYGVNLLEDRRGRIWTQLHVYDPATDRLTELGPADGLQLGTGWFNAYGQSADGRMLFGGSLGLMVVRPEAYEPSPYAPPLVVSELRVNGQRQAAGRAATALQISPGQRSFSIEFAALDYSAPERLGYRYLLQGFDPDWIRSGAEQRSASYSQLSPGDYVLRVRATNRHGVWSPHELAIPVQVLPAWWQQRWLHGLIGLLGLALVYALVHLRTRQLRHRERVLEGKVSERTAALEHLTHRLRKQSADLQESSFTDPLTGLRNRRFITQHLDGDTALAVGRYTSHRERGTALVEADLLFFVLDMDHFKTINDRHGHAAGDAVLVQMCERLRQVFRDSDYLVRWGGEEFLVVARGARRSDAAALAERARLAVAARPFSLDDGQQLDCSCSLGFACFPLSVAHPGALDWSETIGLADAALYAAKTRGRNAWVGVVDSGSLDEAALRQHPPAAQWLASGQLSTLQS